ncbi:MAG: nitric oxide reductase, partial [Nitrospiraceae bacterium]
MVDLLGAALGLGWPVLVFLVCLLLYFQFGLKDPQVKQRAVFKTFIGIIAAFMALIAIANYQVNFFGNSRLLPVSLVMITAL